MPSSFVPGVIYVGLPILVLPLSPLAARGQEPPVPCDQLESFHRLDFWVGEWDVEVAGELVGTNRIEKVLDGCAVTESWRSAGGSAGRSLFFYNSVTDTWKQVWVTQNATMPGGLKEKTLVETLEDGSLRFQGTVSLPGGGSYMDRTTLVPLPDGRVRQVIETSDDDGATWQVRFDAVYVPAAPGPPDDPGRDAPPRSSPTSFSTSASSRRHGVWMSIGARLPPRSGSRVMRELAPSTGATPADRRSRRARPARTRRPRRRPPGSPGRRG